MASLDPLARTLSKQLIDTSRSQTSLLIVSSHIISELEEMCDYLVLLSGGRVALAGWFEDLLDSWRSGALQLDGSRVNFDSSSGGNHGLDELVNEVLLFERSSLLSRANGSAQS